MLLAFSFLSPSQRLGPWLDRRARSPLEGYRARREAVLEPGVQSSGEFYSAQHSQLVTALQLGVPFLGFKAFAVRGCLPSFVV